MLPPSLLLRILRLTLGGGLLIFASVLSDAYFERPRRSHIIGDASQKVTSSSLFDYKYGWSFFAAGAAFFMSELAAVLSISAYIRRFPTVEEMVRVMVPGAERRLKECHGIAGEYLVQHQNKYQRHDTEVSGSLTSGLSSKCYTKNENLSTNDLEGIESTVLLTKPAPDICSSNPAVIADDVINFANTKSTSSNIIAAQGGGFCLKSEPPFILNESSPIIADSDPINLTKSSLAGQTVPIVLMHNSQRSLGPFLYTPPRMGDEKGNSKVSTLPAGSSAGCCFKKTEFRQSTATLPSRHFRQTDQTEISTLDRGLVLPNQFCDFDEQSVQRFGFDLNGLSPNLNSNASSFFGTFHNDGFMQSNLLGPASDIPGTSSTTSSSSGGASSGTTITTGSSLSSSSRNNFPSSSEKKKKKTVTIGNVFSMLDTFESDRTDPGAFASGSAV